MRVQVGYKYDRRMISGLAERGWSVDVRELHEGFPRPDRAALENAARTLAAVPDGAIVLIDSLALGAMPDEVEREQDRLRIVALVHSTIASQIGLDRDAAGRLRTSECRALAAATLSVVTGRSTIDALIAYGIPRDRVVLVQPGTDAGPVARGSQSTAAAGLPLQFLCVATLNAGKGHDILLRALSTIASRDWRLTCAGSPYRDPVTASHLRDLVRSLGLGGQVSFAGELRGADLEACWDRADVFVLATRQESYGMAVAEALAHGLPVVSTVVGAIPELVGNDAGLLVPPDDAVALAAALSRVVEDSAFRLQLGDGARRVRERLPTWSDAFDKMAAALEQASHG